MIFLRHMPTGRSYYVGLPQVQNLMDRSFIYPASSLLQKLIGFPPNQRMRTKDREDLGGSTFEVVIPFITPESANAALEAVGKLSHGLNVRVRVIAVRFVPFAAPIECPPISVGFLETILQALSFNYPFVCEIHLTRDPEQTWSEVLLPGSLIVMAPLKRVWRSHEEKLARALRRWGHEVCTINTLPSKLRKPAASFKDATQNT